MGANLLVNNPDPRKSRSSSPLVRPGTISETLEHGEYSGENGGVESIQMEGRNPPRSAGRVSFLTIPQATAEGRRPSTVDVVIDKLQVEKVDGRLSIRGVSFAENCHLTLIIFCTIFILAGLVLSYVGFATARSEVNDLSSDNTAEQDAKEHKLSHTHYQMQIIGPTFLVVGVLMLVLGLIFYLVSNKVTADEKGRKRALSSFQMSELERSFDQASIQIQNSPLHTVINPENAEYPILSLRRGSYWMEPPITPFSAKERVETFAHRYPNDDNQRVDSSTPQTPQTPKELLALLDESEKNTHHLNRPSTNRSGISSYPHTRGSTAVPKIRNPFLNSFYGSNEGTTDIATFPEPDPINNDNNSTMTLVVRPPTTSEDRSSYVGHLGPIDLENEMPQVGETNSRSTYNQLEPSRRTSSDSDSTKIQTPQIKVIPSSPFNEREQLLKVDYESFNSLKNEATIPRISRQFSESRPDTAFSTNPYFNQDR